MLLCSFLFFFVMSTLKITVQRTLILLSFLSFFKSYLNRSFCPGGTGAEYIKLTTFTQIAVQPHINIQTKASPLASMWPQPGWHTIVTIKFTWRSLSHKILRYSGFITGYKPFTFPHYNAHPLSSYCLDILFWIQSTRQVVPGCNGVVICPLCVLRCAVCWAYARLHRWDNEWCFASFLSVVKSTSNLSECYCKGGQMAWLIHRREEMWSHRTINPEMNQCWMSVWESETGIREREKKMIHRVEGWDTGRRREKERQKR